MASFVAVTVLLGLLALPRCTTGLCTPLSPALAMQRNTAQQDKVQELDEAAWKSTAFWTEARRELPRIDDDPAMLRFRGFCKNLRTCEPGDIVTHDNGQELFTQVRRLRLEPSTSSPAHPATHASEPHRGTVHLPEPRR